MQTTETQEMKKKIKNIMAEEEIRKKEKNLIMILMNNIAYKEWNVYLI